MKKKIFARLKATHTNVHFLGRKEMELNPFRMTAN